MTVFDKRRPRRLAADEAHAWARNLRLRNPHAKLVLSMLCLYVNGDGSAYVGLDTLADDCELAINTVRSRLAWLEEIGAIVRLPQWVDEHGRRNGEVRGRRTTDDIRLMIHIDPEAIEARAAGKVDAADPEISPPPDGGLNPASESVSPAVGVHQPSNCVEGLISEPEPESSPPNPLSEGGVPATISKPEHFDGFFTACLGWRTMDEALALVTFHALTPEEQAKARAAAPLHADECTKFKRRSKDAHKLLRERFWDRYPNAKLPSTPPQPVWFASEQLEGLRVALCMIDAPHPALVNGPGGLGQWRTRPISPDLDAMAMFRGGNPDDWPLVQQGSKQFFAWAERLKEWTGLRVEPRKYFLEPLAEANQLPPSHPDFRMRKADFGLRVPHPWPPKKDGTFCDDQSNSTEQRG